MKGVIYIGINLLLGMLTGCNAVDGLGEEGEGMLYPVNFTLADLAQETRAADGTATALKEGTELTIAAYNPNTKDLVAQRQYKVNASANGLDLANPSDDAMFLPVGTYDFCAMTPAQTLSADGRYGTVAKDVDALGSVTRAQMGKKNTDIQLDNLRHLMSQINFTVQVVKQKVNTVSAFTVQSIGVEGMVTASSSNYKLPENELIKPGVSETGRYETLTISGPFTTGEQGDGTAPGFINKQESPLIVFPKEESSFNAVVKVNIQKADETSSSLKELKVKINRLAFEPGKRYLFEVNYGWDYVRFSISVANWLPINLDGEIGSGEQTVGNSIIIAEWEEPIDNSMTI